MESAVSQGDFLPLASLRLLVPPFQLLSASMWHVLKKQDVMSYWKVAEFVSLVVDLVPELLKHRTLLILGLRARYILELCRSEQPLEPEQILSCLDKIQSPNLILMRESDEEVVGNFVVLIHELLKDPETKRDFFKDVFPAEYGPQYDSDLQTLFSEFLCRLAQLLPVPDLEQTVCWLGAERSLLEDCVQTIAEPADLKHLLQHHRGLGHLDQHVPPASTCSILSSLSALSSQKVATMTEQPDQSAAPSGLCDDMWTVMVVDDNVVEIIAVSDDAEVEVGDAGDCFEGVNAGTHPEDSLCTFSEEKNDEEGAEEETIVAGPHDCPDCGKKFKFASSLLAHRVIHSGERPHRCSDCGRCFSFRQSLHRHTHTTGRTHDCVTCGDGFHSLSAHTQHKHTHVGDCVFTCHQCNKRFSLEHLKTRSDDGEISKESAGERPELLKPVADIIEADVDPAEPDCLVRVVTPPRECQSDEAPSEPGGPAAERDKDIILPVNVRTSGRQRRPTMKVQAINLQKHMATKQKKDFTAVNPAAQKPLPFISSEHSYGSLRGSKDGHESSPADASTAAVCPQSPLQLSDKVQALHHTDTVHPVDTLGDKLSPQPLSDGGGRYCCADCGKTFQFQSLLKAHRRVHTGEQPFSCSQCGRRFSFKQSLERHKQTHRCLICGELFESAGQQREHRSTHVKNGEYLCSECGQVFTWKSALVRHLRAHGSNADKTKESYRCPRCDLDFSCASVLKRHLNTHTEERSHACSCGKSFAYRAALTAHQRIHQKERPHTCSQCGKGFLYKGGLLSHMKTHSEEMPFMCSFCGKSFKRERNMKKHERCHTRENVFSCSQCDKSFVYKATLVRHELTHSGERPYLCSDCGKSFFSHAELLKHERFHTGHKPFQCPHCSKTFTQSCYLTIHLRYHTGARPYSCCECDKSFLSANRLKRHQRTHSGEKPYLCAKCGKRFGQSYHLKMHHRTHI